MRTGPIVNTPVVHTAEEEEEGKGPNVPLVGTFKLFPYLDREVTGQKGTCLLLAWVGSYLFRYTRHCTT